MGTKTKHNSFLRIQWKDYHIISQIYIMYFADDPAFGPRTTLVFGYQQFFRVRPSDKEVIEDKEVLLQCQVANQAGLVQVIHLLTLFYLL